MHGCGGHPAGARWARVTGTFAERPGHPGSDDGRSVALVDVWVSPRVGASWTGCIDCGSGYNSPVPGWLQIVSCLLGTVRQLLLFP